MASLEDQQKCNLNDIKSCPQASIIKILLKRLHKLKTSDAVGTNDDHSLFAVFQKHNYSVSELLTDLHHLKYEHQIDGDDAKFDAAFDFFNDSPTGSKCDINQCEWVQRHFRDRGQSVLSANTMASDTLSDEVLLDTMAMIHCYFVHSFDLYRLTKEEREGVEIESSYGVGLDDENKMDTESGDLRRTKLVADILRKKQQKLQFRRGDRRYRDVEYGQSASEKIVDFPAMAQVVGVEEKVLRDGLSEYEQDRDRLIGDLIDVVYGENVDEMAIWKTLKIDDDRKRVIFRQILYDHFKCTQLRTENMIKMCCVVVKRMDFEIDTDELQNVLKSNGIDGRIYDKTNQQTYQSVNDIAKKFKSIPNCKGQHIRRMYNVVKKWKYVKSKEEKAVKKQEETVDDGKEDEKEVVDDDQYERPSVYEIGKQFYFWDSLKGHQRYVKAKYVNMKEELLYSPLLDGLVSLRSWDQLTKDIAVILATEYAQRITSNGISYSLYEIRKYEPFDAEHLRSLKLYTDFTEFCSNFCAILRWGDPVQIAEIANLTRILIETVQCYGTPLSQKTNYWRGINRAFYFRTIATKFNLPWSTTSSVTYSDSNIFAVSSHILSF